MKVYNYKNGEIAIFENDEKILINKYPYFVENGETNNLFSLASREVENNLDKMVSPSVKDILNFADSNKCEVKVIEKEISNISFSVKAYYISEELKEVEIYRNGSKMISYYNNDTNKGAIESVKNQLGINF